MLEHLKNLVAINVTIQIFTWYFHYLHTASLSVPIAEGILFTSFMATIVSFGGYVLYKVEL